jgi:hypothetical protein
MSPLFYQILHVIGILLVFAGFGGLIAGGDGYRPAMKLHGIGLLIVLAAGFGMIAKLGYSYTSTWVIGKIVILLLLGFLPVLAKRRVLQPGVIVLLAIVLGGVAAHLVYTKPGMVVTPAPAVQAVK